jgi:hypothetical protein
MRTGADGRGIDRPAARRRGGRNPDVTRRAVAELVDTTIAKLASAALLSA